MLVVVLAVNGVAVPIVHVVHVVTVRDCHVAAALTVRVVVSGVGKVVSRLALVEMPVMHPVEMTVVRVIHVVTVRHCHVTAALTVRVAVVGVFEVCRRHEQSPFRCPRGFMPPGCPSAVTERNIILGYAHECCASTVPSIGAVVRPDHLQV